ncbi:unnamed protein product, partial [Bubo scandiacus]
LSFLQSYSFVRIRQLLSYFSLSAADFYSIRSRFQARLRKKVNKTIVILFRLVLKYSSYSHKAK